MYICVCKNITEEKLESLARKGKGPKELESYVCHGADCGTCLVFAKEKIEQIYNQVKARSSKKS